MKLSHRQLNLTLTVFNYLDIFVVIIAIAFPTFFVTWSHATIQMITFQELNDISVSYAMFILLAAMVFSVIRSIKHGANRYSNKALLFSSFAPAVVLFVIISSPGTASRMDASAVVSPYWNYVLAVFFCLGAGYCLATIAVEIYERKK